MKPETEEDAPKIPPWLEWHYCESCDYQWQPGEYDNPCKGCGGYGRKGLRNEEGAKEIKCSD